MKKVTLERYQNACFLLNNRYFDLCAEDTNMLDEICKAYVYNIFVPDRYISDLNALFNDRK